ncbi:protein phosphatase 2C family protein [Actinidia rufa]|uniref:Protein phosphatase 2C family protein n=1 Tax=Actinidia rufa TaxID=165716 RepID=A0A7J0E7L9_9ERIC|nr:protein phosphatase 2C family protein [Actinidia rufa]
MVEERHNERPIRVRNEDDHKQNAENCGPRVRFEGSSRFISMYTQQGRKGTNQDAMTVWENFNGEKDAYFCAVFDGHGPFGHKVARQDCIIKSFEEVDEDLCVDATTLDTYCSGTTAVAVLKQGDHLVIANLGDSRAVLCTRGDNNQIVSVQLTVDLKPNLPSKLYILMKLKELSNVKAEFLRWTKNLRCIAYGCPKENCPGLAMARAFGDFCLKDFGLISTPEVYYRKLTNKDEFVVLATDGVWDVLSNNEVVKIVASARKRSTAARLLVDYAVQAWRHKYPTSKVDDCAAICLFFKNKKPSLTKSMSEASRFSKNYPEMAAPAHHHPKNIKTDDGLDTVINCEVSTKKLPRSGKPHQCLCSGAGPAHRPSHAIAYQPQNKQILSRSNTRSTRIVRAQPRRRRGPVLHLHRAF